MNFTEQGENRVSCSSWNLHWLELISGDRNEVNHSRSVKKHRKKSYYSDYFLSAKDTVLSLACHNPALKSDSEKSHCRDRNERFHPEP